MINKSDEFNSNKSSNFSVYFMFIVIFLIITYLLLAYFMPMKTITGTTQEVKAPPTDLSTVVFPSYGQSAIGAVDYGILSSNGEQNSHAIASIAKTILALSVMKEKPFKTGEQGETYTFTQADIDLYKANLAQNGSVVPIALNEQLSEYQMLQALLVPSGDNIADTMAIWVFGSIENYLTYANKMLGEMGLTKSRMGDASGLSPQTVSSASDLVILGEYIMEEPVLADIVGQTQVTLPVLNTAKNYNTLLGINGVIGIKTGNTDEAGGCLLFAYKKNLDGKDITFVGIILGAGNRAVVLNDTRKFIQNNPSALGFTPAITKNQVVGSYKTIDGKTINAVAKDDVKVLTSKTNQISVESTLQNVKKPIDKNTEVGTITIKSGGKTFTTQAILESKISKPAFWWRLLHSRSLF